MGVAFAGGAQQDHGAGNGARGQHHLMGAEQPALPLDACLHAADLQAAGGDVQSQHLGTGALLERWLAAGPLQTEALGIAAGILH